MRILLVDDDAGVLQALQAILNTVPGHEVRTAGNGGQAMVAAREMGGLDLLITDVVMEPMDGFTLRDRLRSQYPGAKTILISGFDLSEYPEQTQGYQLLTKPIDAEVLRAAIDRELPAAPEPVAAPEPEPVVEAAPQPEPEAVPEPAPTPVPVARPAAVPVSAKPTAVPGARPVAVPVARPAVAAQAAPAPAAVSAPKAVPAPVATPKAVPSAAVPVPTATPKVPPTAGAHPVPVATPKAVPSAPPAPAVKATAVPPPTARPTAVPAPGQPPRAEATTHVNPTVKAQAVPPPSVPGVPPPTARPVSPSAPSAAAPVKAAAVPGAPVKTTSVPTPAPRPSAVATKAIPAAVPPPSAIAAAGGVFPSPVFSGEDLSGTNLGAYELQRKIGEGRWGGIYAGVQTSINRPVAMEVLDSTKAADPSSQARFVADARAKAAVQHPSILAVYEAGEANERFFYAYEYVDGQTITELKAAGQRLDEVTALKVLRVAADGLSYFSVHHTPHTPPDASSISLGVDGHPRLANLATQHSDETLAAPEEIQALGRVMLGVLPAIQSLSPGLRELLKRMVQAGPQALTSWGQLLQGIKALEPKIVPTDAAKISAQDRAAIAAVEAARKQQKKSLMYNLVSVASLLLLLAFTAWFFLRNKQRIYDEQILIPAGEFIFANGDKKTLPDFWIDKYEVTFGQYAEFVKALEEHPTTEFDHKMQPKSKNSAMHKPEHWAIYWGQAEVGGKARSIPIDKSCPVIEVDFWDAYAYAKWKGRELPTEEEWEKAARGTKGFLYPWGDAPNPKNVNSNADHNPNDPSALGKVDGYNFWNPVDKVKGDKSPFEIVGMAGNVREWTGTWDAVKKRPVVKGGSFMSSDVTVSQRADLDPNAASEGIGFRTISRTPPTK
jgi:formylglycine-generating enzyme required for sulfatase activity/CheY-like chemotaxis protein